MTEMRESGGFRGKIFASAKLSSLKFLSNIGLRVVSTVVLTRLLAPEIYGVFALVLVYMYLLEMLSDFGIRSLILTKEGNVEDDFLRTCWTVSIFRGALIALLSLGIAGAIAYLQARGSFVPDSAYASEQVPLAIAAMGGVAFITGFRSPMSIMSERAMNFNRVTVVTIVENIFALIVTIALAVYLRSVWALVFGAALKAILHVSLSFLLFSGPEMRLRLNPDHLKTIIDRGKWIIGHSILYSLSNAADRLVLGFVMSSDSFGYYYIARQLVDVVNSFLASMNTQMGLQVFTHLHKSSTEEFRHNYYRYRLFFDAVAGLSTGILFVLSPLIVQILFDDRYLEVAEIVQAVVWALLLTGPLLLNSAFSAERRFKEMTMLSIVSVVTLWSGLGVAVFWLDSVPAALSVIALYRLPEAMLFILRGGDRDWVIVWREFLGFGFCALGIIIGLGCLGFWNILI